MSQNLRKPNNPMYPNGVASALAMAMSCGVNIFTCPPKEEYRYIEHGDCERDHAATIKKADKKRALRNAKRLKNWNK